MKSIRRKALSALCLSQATLLLASAVLIPVPVQAMTPSEMSQLDQCEHTVFGEEHTKLEAQTRLKDLEMNLFGHAKTGSDQERIAAVAKAIGAQKSNLLMPAMAPQMDNSLSADTAPGLATEGGLSMPDAAPDRSKELLKQAVALYSANKTAEAEQAFKRVLTVDKNSVDAYYNLGVIAEGKGDLQSALLNYNAAYRLNPGDNDLREAVASVQKKVQDNAVAIQQQRQQQLQQQQQKSNLKHDVLEASAAFKSGDYDKSIGILQNVQQQAPSDPDVMYALAQAYKAKGDLNEAKATLNRAISIDPNNQLYRNSLNQVNESIAQAIGGGGSSDNSGMPPAAPDYANHSQIASADTSGGSGSAPAGQITGFQEEPSSNNNGLTPFAGDGSRRSAGLQQGYAMAPGSFGGMGGGMFGGGFPGMRGGFGGGMAYGGYPPGYGGGTRLQRATSAGLRGAAMGAVMGTMMGGGMRGGMRGAMLGGAMGIIMGGLFSR